jgi:2,4-dienoyl-CoA reductase-like NADH-dependent reductase (Old Yellow Enzyme family)
MQFLSGFSDEPQTPAADPRAGFHYLQIRQEIDTLTRDPRFDILFEPVKIGPVVAKNRFYQVPHCNGMGYLRPRAHAAMRGVKAEGGWAVVSTEEVEIHPSRRISTLARSPLPPAIRQIRRATRLRKLAA